MRLPNLEAKLKLVANEKRLEILRLLRHKEALPVWYIADKIQLSHHATSKHVLMLYRGDLLERLQDGLEVLYYIPQKVPQVVRMVLKLM